VSGEIFFIGLQVFGDTVDPFCQQSNLALNRTGVCGGATKIGEKTRFFLVCQIRHLKMFVCTGMVYPENKPIPCTRLMMGLRQILQLLQAAKLG
jgi:hypothetical protein